jgi:hypothetical protein
MGVGDHRDDAGRVGGVLPGGVVDDTTMTESEPEPEHEVTFEEAIVRLVVELGARPIND